MTNNKACPICNRQAEIWWWQGHHGSEANCPYCGYYRIGSLLHQHLTRQWSAGETPDPLLSYLSAYTRQAAEPPVLTSENWKDFAVQHHDRPVAEKENRLIRIVRERSPHAGARVAISDIDWPLFDAGDPDEANFFINELAERGLVKHNGQELSLTPHGWTYVEQGAAKTSRRIFLSHAAEDGKLASALAEAFRKYLGPGTDVFVASEPGNIPGGEKWLNEIESRLLNSDAYVTLLTPTSITKPWVWWETGYAWFSGKLILPVAGSGLNKNDIPPPLSFRQVLEVTHPVELVAVFKRLGVTLSDQDAANAAATFAQSVT